MDEKGRLKLPADLREYILRLGEKTVFITSLDLLIARIYTNSTWEFNQKLLDECKEDPETAEDVAFTANDVGADSDIDDQGRVLIPQELRRLLSIENASSHNIVREFDRLDDRMTVIRRGMRTREDELGIEHPSV